jgi:DNA repair exonuclease SbcCD ATPase subunit
MESSYHELNVGSTLPENHDDQLQLGFRMIQNAFTSKVNSLDHEIRAFRMTCEEQKNQAMGLQRKHSALEVELVEGHQRAQQLGEENKELFRTVQQLRRQLARLEGLKKTLQDSVADHQLADVEHEDGKHYLRDEYLHGATPLTLAAVQSEAVQAFPRPPALTPAAAPEHHWQPSPGSQQPSLQQPGSQQPGSQQLTGSSMQSPTEAVAAAPDGRQFFRMARSALSYEAFNEFLANIKRLNGQQQSHEETLAQAAQIFGYEHQNLYTEFELLLNRQSGLAS